MPTRRVVHVQVGGSSGSLRADAINGVASIATFTLQSMTGQAAATMTKLVSNYDQFATVLQSQVRNSRRTFAAAHDRAAKKAQARMLQVYEENVEATKGPVYRTGTPENERNRRYAGGQLRAVLESANFVRASYTGVAFGDIEELDAKAKQWARLNYGAGDKGKSGEPVGNFGVGPYTQGFAANMGRFMNAAATKFLEDSPGPRPSFRIPRGFWFTEGNVPTGPQGGGTGDKFYPYSHALAQRVYLSHLTGLPIDPEGGSIPNASRLRMHGAAVALSTARPTASLPTAGIAARKFIDAGITELFSSLGQEYSTIVNRWFELADNAGRGPIARAGGAIQNTLSFEVN